MSDPNIYQAVCQDTGRCFATGWIRDPAEVWAVVRMIEAEGIPAQFSQAAPHLLQQAADDDPIFFWQAEQAVLGRVLPSWDQGQAGTCVSMGYGRGSQDLLLWEIAAGEPEQWPGYEVATEPIYGGSRVEVGGGRISGDGSIGAWAAKWVRDWGLLLRTVYQIGGQSYDLTHYSESLSRLYGSQGVPDPLEPEARIHPVTAVAMVRNGDELWSAIGAGKPVPVCSMQGFTTTRDADGYCRRQGQWAHCMLYRSRFVHPQRGRSVVIQNSWGGYLGGPDMIEYVAKDGSIKTIEMPQGCFAVELPVAHEACQEDDTFALAGATGWAVTRVDYTP